MSSLGAAGDRSSVELVEELTQSLLSGKKTEVGHLVAP